MTVERKGTVVRCVDHLDISPECKHIAKELVDQIDMPVVFLIDHDLDKQYALRSQGHHNQFWVLANHHEDQAEYERVILSNIYRGIQERDRFLHPAPCAEYEKSIDLIQDKNRQDEQRKLYYELLRRISSLVSTIDAEQFLKPRGVEVSSKQKQWLYDNRIMLLEEYLEIQREQPYFCWYKEIEYMNMLDYSRIASFCDDYRIGIFHRLKKIRPASAAKRCIKRLTQLMAMIKEAEIKYIHNSQEDIAGWMTQEIVRILELENILVLKREYALVGKFNLETGNCANIYSFVPSDFTDKELNIQAMRHVNECILLIQEFYATFMNRELPDVHANLIHSHHQNAYANRLGEKCYISVTSGLFLQILHAVSTEIDKVPSQCVAILGEQEILHRLKKYAIFYITAHEYAHIINGDCEEADWYQATWDLINKRETAADNIARSILKEVLLFQYRPDMRTSLFARIQEMQINRSVDELLLDLACSWCDQYFSRLVDG